MSAFTVLRFTSDWCKPCKLLAPIIEELSQEFPEATFVTHNIDEPNIAQEYGIRNVPTVLVIDAESIERSRIVGAFQKDVYRKAFEQAKER